MGHKTALQTIEAVLALPEPDRTNVLFNSDVVRAVEALSQSLAANAGSPDLAAHIALGWWYFLSSRLEKGERADKLLLLAMAFLGPVNRVTPNKVPPDLARYLHAKDLAERGTFLCEQAIFLGNTHALDQGITLLQQGIATTPDGHTARARDLSNLGLALAARFERSGSRADLDEAITSLRDAVSATPHDHPDQAKMLSNLGNALRTRFERTGSRADLDDLITTLRDAVSATPHDHPDRANMLSNLGAVLANRFERSGSRADLDEAITSLREAVGATPDGQPDRATYLSNLGNALRMRFADASSGTDLDEAITTQRDAVSATPTGHPDRARYLSGLGIALTHRFKRTGTRAVLDGAITTLRDAVSATPNGHPDRARYLSNLGTVLTDRFERTGSQTDLDEAITILRDAVSATPHDHPNRVTMLSNLGNALRTRFERTGSRPDLAEAITTQRDAVSATPHDHPDRARYLSNLGLALTDRFQRTGSRTDLNEAITALRDAVTATPHDHPDRAKMLSHLGLALRTGFQRTGSRADLLDEAITALRDAVSATPHDEPDLATHLSNLGNTLRIRFAHAGNWADLEEAITTLRDAITTIPHDHPNRAKMLSNLGIALDSLFKRTELPVALAGAVDAFREAASHTTAAPSVACGAAVSWGHLTPDASDRTVAYERALKLLPRIARRWLSDEDTLAATQEFSRLGSDAAAAFVARGHYETAVVALEQARAVVFTRTLELRGDLQQLRATDPAKAQRLDEQLRVLDSPIAPTASGPQTLEKGTYPLTRVIEDRRTVASELDQLLDQIRMLPGLQRFFLPPAIEDLLPAADQGPVVVLNVAELRCDALILTPTGVELLPMPDLTFEDSFVRAITFLSAVDTLANRRSSKDERDHADRDIHQVMAWLWDTAISPVLTHLGHHQPRTDTDFERWPRVWWMPSGPLTLLPIHAAGHHLPPSTAHPSEPALSVKALERTVIDRVVSSTLPTISSLIHTRARREPVPVAHRLLAIAMPHTPQSSDIPGTTEEITRIRDIVGVDTFTALCGPLADTSTPPFGTPTYESVSAALPEYAWAHFACHGWNKPAQPAASSLLLWDHLTHPFTVRDLAQAHLPEAQLAYFSACTTARTGYHNLDEPLHFASAALLAGYRHTIATLWPIPDEAETADIVYSTLTHSSPVDWTAATSAVAVHTATHTRRVDHCTHIYRWAPHIHQGP